MAVHSYKLGDSFRTGRYPYTSKAGYQGHCLMATACAELNRSIMLLADSFNLTQVWTPNGAFLESLTPGTEGKALRLSIAALHMP